MRIVHLSDIHGGHDRLQVPDGDLLLHAGDIKGRAAAPRSPVPVRMALQILDVQQLEGRRV